ncbi:hypothetical protein [Pelagerythrobacter aerophilus]|uniref:hypothetical protein n=1 Tax=Pelagerythrobacter aerophilus TaxID=2306995 RepID=UPI0011C4228C|nr:hypothetical protein [Pelagerythrobacter aerophilus]
MKYLFSVAATVALTVSAAASAHGQAEDAPRTSGDDTEASQNRVICKRQKNTGSRLSAEKICLTAAQWAQLKRDQREATERTQSARWKSD